MVSMMNILSDAKRLLADVRPTVPAPLVREAYFDAFRGDLAAESDPGPGS